MALTRKMLKAMGIDDDKIDEIIEAHSETVDALKEQRDSFKADAEKVASLTAEIESLKTKGDDGYKEKYEKVNSEFETYKSSIEEEKATNAKKSAYRKLLKDAGISESALDNVLKVSDMSTIEMDGENIKNAESITEGIKKDWSGFIVKENTSGANPANPTNQPTKAYTAADIKGMSASEINQNWDAIKASLNGGK